MELFSTTGFEVDDKVYVDLDGIKYFGTIINTDDRLDRVQVDYSASMSRSSAIDWFHKSFWTKVA